MFFYEIGYYSYEDSSYKQLYHEKEFTDEQFEQMIYECVPESINRFFKKHGRVDRVEKEQHIGFDELHHYISDIMCENFGFSYVKYTTDFCVDGWTDLVPAGQQDEEDKEGKEGREQRLRTKVHEAYVNAGYWKDENEYKYVWSEVYINSFPILDNAIKQAQELGIRLEMTNQEVDRYGDSPPHTIYMRIPKEDACKLPKDGSGQLYLGEAGSRDNIWQTLRFNPMWFSRMEFWKEYRIAEREWKVVSDER